MTMPDARSVLLSMSNREAAQVVLLQRRALSIATAFALLGLVLWIVAISTDYWCIVDGGIGIYLTKTKNYFLQSHNGLWRHCRTLFFNKTKTKPPMISDECDYIDFSAGQEEQSFLHYERSVAAFSLISLLILIMAFGFSIYTFKHTRYMYKRLAACSHVVAAGCVLIVIEVSTTATEYATSNVTAWHPSGSVWYYGFSFVLAWISFSIELIAAISFAICSRKKKKDKAPDEQFAIEEEPTIIGR